MENNEWKFIMEQNVLKCVGRGLLSRVPVSVSICWLLLCFIYHPVTSWTFYHWLQGRMTIECDFMVFCTGRPAGSLCSEMTDALRPRLAGLETWGSKFCQAPQHVSSASAPFSSDPPVVSPYCRANLCLPVERHTARVQKLMVVIHINYCCILKSM